MPDNKPEDILNVSSGAVELPRMGNDLWSLYLDEANERANAKADLWHRSLDAFLLFAGLFASVVSVFLTDSRKDLQPDPPASVNTNTVATNFLWYASLTFTLISALAVVLAQTWIVRFRLVPFKGFQGAKHRWIHDEKAEAWHLHAAVNYITMFIQLALFLFLAGLTVQAVEDRKSIGWTILSLAGITGLLYLFISVLPWLSPTTPFRTPLSDLDLGTLFRQLFYSLNTDSNTSAKGVLIKSKDQVVGVWRSGQSSWRKLFETPPEEAVRQGICWAILKHSSNNNSIHAAVLELTTHTPSSKWPSSRARLLEFGLPGELCRRLQETNTRNDADVAQIQDYLRMIFWMMDEKSSSDSENHIQPTPVVLAFSRLLESGGSLLNLDALPSKCRALAFAIRVQLLAHQCKHDRIWPTDWDTLVNDLEPEYAPDIFRVAISGLASHTRSYDLGRDSTRLLAAWIISRRFSSGTTAGSPGVEHLITQPDPPTIESFLKLLESEWKSTMCIAAIRLLQEGRAATGSKILVSFVQKEQFSDPIARILRNIIGLLSDQTSPVRAAAYTVLDQMKKDSALKGMNDFSSTTLEDLKSPYWRSKATALDSLAELIKSGYVHAQIVDKALPDIIACMDFKDEDVRLAVIRALQELLSQGSLTEIKDNLLKIIELLNDESPSVRAASILLLADMARKAELKDAVNNHIEAIVTTRYKSEKWYIRCVGLQALQKFMEADHDLYVNAIKTALRGISGWLADSNSDVQEEAVKIISLGLRRDTYFPEIQQGVLNIFSQDRFPTLRISALKIISEIVRVPNATQFKTTIEKALQQIQDLLRLSSDWLACNIALQTLCTLVEMEPHNEMNHEIHETAMSSILGALVQLPDYTLDSIRCQVISTLGKVASKSIFHKGLTAHISEMLPLLEDWNTDVQNASLQSFAMFAKNKILVDSDSIIISHLISLLADNDSNVCGKVLRILSITATYDPPSIQDDISFALSHKNWRVRLAGLRVAQSRAEAPNGESNNITIDEILPCLGDDRLEVQVEALRTLCKLIDTEVLRYRVLNEKVSMLNLPIWENDTQDTASRTIEKLIQKLVKVHKKDDDAYLAILQMICSLSSTDGFCTNSQTFATIKSIITDPLLPRKRADIRITTFQIIYKVSKYLKFRTIVSNSVSSLVTASQGDSVVEIRVNALQVLSKLAVQQETFRSAIQNQMSSHYALGIEDVDLSARVAFFKLMWNLSAPELNLAVKDTMVDIIDLLQDDDHSVQNAAVEFLAIPAVKETPPNPLKLLKTLANLLSQAGKAELKDASTVRQLLADLAKRDVFRKVMTEALPTMLDQLDRDDWAMRVAALETWAILLDSNGASDEIVDKAGPKVGACLKDPDDDVRIKALAIFAEFSHLESFHLAITMATPDILLTLDAPEWNVRLQAVKLLTKLGENEAFTESISNLSPRILHLLRDPDEDVRSEVLKLVTNLIQQDMHHSEISSSLHPEEMFTIIELMLDHYKQVQIGAMELVLKLIQFDLQLDLPGLYRNVKKVLWGDRDVHVCIAALELWIALGRKGEAYTQEQDAQQLIHLLQSEEADHKMCTTILLTIETFIKNTVGLKAAAKAMQKICAFFINTEHEDCRNAAAKVLLELFSQDYDFAVPVYSNPESQTDTSAPHRWILNFFLSALANKDWRVRDSGLNLLSNLLETSELPQTLRELLLDNLVGAETSNGDLPVSCLLEDVDSKHVWVSAIHLLQNMQITPQSNLRNKLEKAVQNFWVATTAGWKKDLTIDVDDVIKLAAHNQFPNDRSEVVAIIVAAMDHQNLAIQLSSLRAISKMTKIEEYHYSLVQAVPRMTMLLSKKGSDSSILLQILDNVLKMAQYKQFRSIITKEISRIIPILSNRDPKIRAACLQVLVTVAGKIQPAENLPERIKQTMPILLTLLENQITRNHAVDLMVCLAKDRTLRTDLLSKLLPLVRTGPPKLCWSHLFLISRLLKDKTLEREESDLRLVFCLTTSKERTVQDFILKSMTDPLLEYMKYLMSDTQFPTSVAAVFSVPKI